MHRFELNDVSLLFSALRDRVTDIDEQPRITEQKAVARHRRIPPKLHGMCNSKARIGHAGCPKLDKLPESILNH